MTKSKLNGTRKQKIESRYLGLKGKVLRINRGFYATSMTKEAFDHMQLDDYGARTCEVFDNQIGTLHAVFRRTPKEVITRFRRDPTTGMSAVQKAKQAKRKEPRHGKQS